MNAIEKQKDLINLSQALQDNGAAPELLKVIAVEHGKFLDTLIVESTPQEKPMDKENILRVQIDALDQELAGIHRAKILMEVKIIDAATPTGNDQVDAELKQHADNARKTLLAQDRMLEVRIAKVADLQAQADALK